MTHVVVFVFVIHFKEMILSRNTPAPFQKDKEHASFHEGFLQLLILPQTVSILGSWFPLSNLYCQQSPKTNKQPESFDKEQGISQHRILL